MVRHRSRSAVARALALSAGLMLLGAILVASGCTGATPGDGGNGGGGGGGGGTGGVTFGSMVVLGYNDLGMHCMNQDFSELMILPPYNNLHAQVIRRGEEPNIVTSGVTVSYAIPSNTHSADKTNFWKYVQPLLGVSLPANVGLTGNGSAGTMKPTGNNDWSATGIPVTPLNDKRQLDPYPLATVTVTSAGQTAAVTQAVVPVSWEISCDLCHTTPGISVATDILRAHDRMHATDLENSRPVMCGNCHAQPALSAPGQPGMLTLSSAMHSAHAPRMAHANLDVDCYACHPGNVTRCLRDVHFSAGMTCTSCHTSMVAVGDPARRPWVDEPTCGGCHSSRQPTYEFEEAGKLYRDSRGHHGVHCEACHGSPHAVVPTIVSQDNLQAIGLQGHPGTLDKCSVCHIGTPDDGFGHTLSGEGGGEDED